MIINEKDIRALAETAKVGLTYDEAAAMTAYFNDAVPFCGAMARAAREGRLALDGVPPYSPAADEPPLPREDIAEGSPLRDAILAAAPEARDGFFVVPRILEEE